MKIRNIVFAFLLAIAFSGAGVLAQEGEAEIVDQAVAPKLSASVKSCLISALGEEAFVEIQAGQRVPSNQEMEAGKDCFENMIEKRASKRVKIKKSTRACVVNLTGQDPEDLQNVTDEVKKQLAEKCFQADKGAFLQFHREAAACVKTYLGENRYQAIVAGSEPTDVEKMRVGPKCFGMRRPEDVKAREDAMPTEQRVCIERVLGQSLASLGPLTEDARKKIDSECFSKEDPNRGHDPNRQQTDEQLKEEGFEPEQVREWEEDPDSGQEEADENTDTGEFVGDPGVDTNVSQGVITCLAGYFEKEATAEAVFDHEYSTSDKEVYNTCVENPDTVWP